MIAITPSTIMAMIMNMVSRALLLVSPSSRFCRNSRALPLFDFLSVSTLKFFIWGTLMLWYYPYVSIKSGKMTLLTTVSLPSKVMSLSSLSLVDSLSELLEFSVMSWEVPVFWRFWSPVFLFASSSESFLKSEAGKWGTFEFLYVELVARRVTYLRSLRLSPYVEVRCLD